MDQFEDTAISRLHPDAPAYIDELDRRARLRSKDNAERIDKLEVVVQRHGEEIGAFRQEKTTEKEVDRLTKKRIIGYGSMVAGGITFAKYWQEIKGIFGKH